MMIQKIKPA